MQEAKLLPLFLILFCKYACGLGNRSGTWTYRAAVYEHRPSIFPVTAQTSWQSIEENLNVYEDQIKTAAENGAQIIVFPEDGLFGINMNRTNIYEYLEIVQDTAEIFVNPCIDLTPTSRNRIQRRLSCAARWYHMYVVANFGTVEFCQGKSPCTPDGRFQYNTNVVFDSDGVIVARYHKQNLFFESQFDVPPKIEYSVFGSPMGSFGSFTCFDILFKEPVLGLIEEVGVVNIVFPTAWSNVMPEMFALGIHESWAIRMGVNLLSAELHIPEVDMQGSGIYSSNDGALVYYNNDTTFSGGKLLISDVTTPPEGPPEGHVNMPTSGKGFPQKENFTAIMESNNFVFVLLSQDRLADELYLENKDTKCYLNYTKLNTSKSEIYAFGIFEGLHISALNSYIQVCALVKCANRSRCSCGQGTRETTTSFETLSLMGQFSSNYIFPSLLVDGAKPSKKNWNFMLDKPSMRGKIEFATLKKPLLSSILYTRIYEKDNNTNNSSNIKNILSLDTKSAKVHFNWQVESLGHSNKFIGETQKQSSSYHKIVIGGLMVVAACGVILAIIKSNHFKGNSKSDYIKL